MKINGTSIKGIYKFDTSALYEIGDFVIDQSNLYVCKQDKASLDEDLLDDYVVTNSTYFSPYPNDFITIDEFNNRTDDNDDSLRSKYISSEVLAKLLQDHFYYGILDGKLKKVEVSDFDIASEAEDSRTDGVKMLEAIATNYNTSIFQLDSTIITDLFGSYSDEEESYYTLISKNFNETDSVYLLQIVFNDNKVAQQIINATNGFQAIRISEDTRTNFKSWYSISPNAIEVKNAIDDIQKSLNDKYNKLSNLKTTLTNHFAFKSLVKPDYSTLTPNEISYTYQDENNGNKWVYPNNRCFVNFIITKEESNIYYSKTVTVDLCEALEKNGIDVYVDEDTNLSITVTDSDNKILGISCGNWSVKNIYYRDNI
jgi:hypothetical protein